MLLTGVVPGQTAMTVSSHDLKSTEVGHKQEVQVTNGIVKLVFVHFYVFIIIHLK